MGNSYRISTRWTPINFKISETIRDRLGVFEGMSLLKRNTKFGGQINIWGANFQYDHSISVYFVIKHYSKQNSFKGGRRVLDFFIGEKQYAFVFFYVGGKTDGLCERWHRCTTRIVEKKIIVNFSNFDTRHWEFVRFE